MIGRKLIIEDVGYVEMFEMPKVCTRNLNSDRHGELKISIGRDEDGSPSVDIVFPTNVGDMNISFNYKNNDEGLAAAIKLFSHVGLEECDSLISQAKKEFGLSKIFEVGE